MARTFAKLAAYVKKESGNDDVNGRSTAHTIPDAMNDGMSLSMTEVSGSAMDVDEAGITAADEIDGVEDDGSIDAH